jgi:RecA-family ATPase
MSTAEIAGDDRPRIDPGTDMAIDRWADVLRSSPVIDKLPYFKAAVADLYEKAYRETTNSAFCSIESDIEALGLEIAELPIETVSLVMDETRTTIVAEGPFRAANLPGEDEPLPRPDDYGVGSVDEPERKPIEPATLITPAAWPPEAPPPVDWLAFQRIPRGDVTTLHGDGGAGKTDIALQLAANCARGSPYWLGHEIVGGPVVVISGEEPEREVRRRIWQHAQRDGYDAASLANLRLWFSDDVGAVLATPDRHGIMQPMPLFRSIEQAITAVAPVLVVVDNVAATFAGNQNDRVMVRSYVNLWRSIARQASAPAVLLLDHPSLSGLTGGTGRGGNMDWRNAVRSALYLRSPEDRAEADRGIRTLETAKSNYGPSGNPVRLQWGDGGLQPEHAPSSLHRLAKDGECEETFLRLLDERNAQGRHVSDKSGKNYAPSVFEEMTGNAGFTAKPFASAMNRLFEARKIVMRTMRRDGHSRDVIDRANAATTPSTGAA